MQHLIMQSTIQIYKKNKNMKTTSQNLDYLEAGDIKTISNKTNYAVPTIYQLLSGKRRITTRNKIVLELAYKIAKIRKQAIEKLNIKISNL